MQPSKLAIDNDGDTFGHTFAMMMQTKKELQDQVAQKTGMGPVSPTMVNDTSITPYAPVMPTRTKAEKKKADNNE